MRPHSPQAVYPKRFVRPILSNSHYKSYQKSRKGTLLGTFSMLALPIFPGRLQPSIVGRSELNFRVRDGNGWTLALISTNYEVYCTFKTKQCIIRNQEGSLPA